MHRDINQFVNSLKTDRSSGAREMALMVLDFVSEYIAENKSYKPQSFASQLQTMFRKIATVRSSMTPILNVVDLMQKCVNPDDSVARQKAEMRNCIFDIKEKITSSSEHIIKYGLELIRNKKYYTLLTHSYSSTVAALIKAAAKEKNIQQVIVTESRPLYEGVTLVKEIASLVETVLITDAQAAYWTKTCSAVIFGADAIGKDYTFINKIGSKAIACCAKSENKPVVFLAESLKMHPRSKGNDIVLEDMSPRELGYELPENIIVRNKYFETIENEFIDYWISEKGVMGFNLNKNKDS